MYLYSTSLTALTDKDRDKPLFLSAAMSPSTAAAAGDILNGRRHAVSSLTHRLPPKRHLRFLLCAL